MFPPWIAKGKRYGGWLSQNACVVASEPTPRNVVMSAGSFGPSPLSVTCHQAPRPSTVGSFELRITPPIQASRPMTVRHVTGPPAENGAPSSTSR
jgi:hypothetical protein